MIRFHYHPSPNPYKVALYLEEAELPYELVPVDTRRGEQHRPAFLALNPNAKTPVIEDDGHVVFDSNAILLWLAEKTGRFLPAPEHRAELLSWLMFVATGIGPYSGQAVHFRAFAPEPKDYAMNRYDFEAWRHWRIVDERLASREWMVGDAYSLVDMAVWGWGVRVPRVLGEGAFGELPHLKRLMDAIEARPAAARARALESRHAFKTAFDDEARRALFPQNARIGA